MIRLSGATFLTAILLLAAACSTVVNTPPVTQTGQTVQLSSPEPEDTEVLAEGAAAVTGSRAAARDHALDDALRKAVEQGVGTWIDSETGVENFQLIEDNIYSLSRGYVSSYRVISEGEENGLYRVVIRAMVKNGKVEDDLAAIGLLLSEQGRPRVMVLVRELSGSSSLDDVSMTPDVFGTRVMESFRSRGFPVVDQATVQGIIEADQLRLVLGGDDATARLLGLRADAEIVVAGTVNTSLSNRMIAGSERRVYSFTTSTRAVNTATGALMGGSAFTLELPFSESAARDRAADSTATALQEAILNGWTVSTNSTEIIADGATYTGVSSLKDQLLEIRGVTDVVTRNLTGTRAVIEVVSEISTAELLDHLGELEETLEITGFTGNRIEITLR